MRFILLLSLFISASASLHAGGIRGTIKADDGSPLAYASIFVKQTGTGSATDFAGKYEVVLPPGRYDVLFQYLGYESVSRVVDVGNDFIEINLTLKTHVMMLHLLLTLTWLLLLTCVLSRPTSWL